LQTAFNKTFTTVDTILLSRKMVEEGYVDHWTAIAPLAAHDKKFTFAQHIVGNSPMGTVLACSLASV
jgi:hypothetical protein